MPQGHGTDEEVERREFLRGCAMSIVKQILRRVIRGRTKEHGGAIHCTATCYAAILSLSNNALGVAGELVLEVAVSHWKYVIDFNTFRARRIGIFGTSKLQTGPVYRASTLHNLRLA